MKKFAVGIIASIIVLSACGAPPADQEQTPALELEVSLNADITSGNVPLVVEFTTETNIEAASLEYAWDFGDGTEVSGAAQMRHTYTETGSFTATVTVKGGMRSPKSDSIVIDVASLEDSDDRVLNVELEVDVAEGTAPLAVTFTATTDNPSSDERTHSWDFGDGTRQEASAVTTHTYSEAGAYIASVQISDGSTVSNLASVSITVWPSDTDIPDSEELSVTLEADKESGVAPLTVTFTSTAHGTDLDSLTYTWEFGDGAEAITATAVESFTFVEAGTFEVTILVEDGVGNSTTASTQVLVRAEEAPDLPDNTASGALLIFGQDFRREFTTYLGCLNCAPTHAESVHNQYGLYTNRYGSTIYNRFGQYGSAFSPTSACNLFATEPPIVIDQAGNYYGRLTSNRFHSDSITDPLILTWLETVVCVD